MNAATRPVGSRAHRTVHSTLAFTIDAGLAGERLDRVVAELIDGLSRSQAQRLIADGRVRLNGAAEKPSLAVWPGDRVEVDNPFQPAASTLEPEAIPLDVVFEDAHLLVVNKPPGMVVHPAPGHDRGTLVHALVHHTAGALADGRAPDRPGIVHRLDRYTSGLLVVAKSNRVHAALAEQLAAREMRREYCALVWGVFAETAGTIEAPVGRSPVDRKRMGVPGVQGRPAVTHFTVAGTFAGASELVLRLQTGRTHQVRLHCAYIGHSVIGDPVYGKAPPRRSVPWSDATWKVVQALEGQMLHARMLGFTHPATREPMQWACEPPKTYADVRALLRAAGDA